MVVCELTDGFLWFVCGNFDGSPYTGDDLCRQFAELTDKSLIDIHPCFPAPF